MKNGIKTVEFNNRIKSLVITDNIGGLGLFMTCSSTRGIQESNFDEWFDAMKGFGGSVYMKRK